MNLKSKVKKRANAFRKYFPLAVNPGEVLDRDLSAIVEVKFEIGSDFQSYFDLINNTHSLIKAIHKDPDHPVQKFFDEDSQKEQVIIRFVKEIKEVSARYNEKVETYNKINPKTKLTPADPIQFESMRDIEHILNLQPDGSEDEISEDEKFDVA